MDESTRQRIREKKERLRIRQQVLEQSRQLEDWWLPSFALIKRALGVVDFAYFTCATGLLFSEWTLQLEREPWATVLPHPPFIQQADQLLIHEAVFDKYPGEHPLRYLPRLDATVPDENEPPETTLSTLFAQLNLSHEPVYFFFVRFTPVLRLPLNEFISLAKSGLFDEMEDLCIVPPDYRWLIFRSLEGEWRYGYGT